MKKTWLQKMEDDRSSACFGLVYREDPENKNKPVLSSITDELREADTSIETTISLELNSASSDMASRS